MHGVNDELLIRDFDISVSDFDATRGREMDENRFMFSDDLGIGLAQLEYKDTRSTNSVSVSDVQLSSKKEMLTLSSVGYSIGGTSPSKGKIPSIKLNGLSFFELAKDKKLFLKSIQIVNPEIAITLPETKPARENSSRIGQLNKYPFDPNQLASVQINENA
jgi:hypothetical protein